MFKVILILDYPFLKHKKGGGQIDHQKELTSKSAALAGLSTS